MTSSRTTPLIAALVLLTGSAQTALAQVPCPPGASWDGPPRRAVPAALLTADHGRSIEGTLPTELVSALDQTVATIIARAPGASVAVAVPGAGTWSATAGRARTRPERVVAADEPFQAASITKAFTAAAVLQLVDAGRLGLTDRVATWFPDVPNASRITVADLLRHTSGLVSFNALPLFTPEYWSPERAIALAAAEAPLFCPGTNFAYSNTGYVMLGRIIEALAGRPLHEVFAARFFEPLALATTSLRQPDAPATGVVGHRDGEPLDVPGAWATAWAAGGIRSTARDLVRFWRALLAGEVVDDVARMLTPMTAMTPDGQMSYGAGAQLYDVPGGPGLMIGHSGGIIGFTSVVAYAATDDVYVAVLLNDQSAPAEAALWALLQTVRRWREGR